jgi:hypothetical protein
MLGKIMIYVYMLNNLRLLEKESVNVHLCIVTQETKLSKNLKEGSPLSSLSY